MRHFRNDYNRDGKAARFAARAAAGFKCIRCGSPSVPGRIEVDHWFWDVEP